MSEPEISQPEPEQNLPAAVTAATADLASQDTTVLVASLKAAGESEDGWPSPELLQAILDRKQEAVAPLIAFVEQASFDAPSIYYAVELLIILQDPTALPAIVQFYRDSGDDFVESIEMSLPTFGPVLVPYLLPTIGDRTLTSYQRSMAFEMMEQASTGDPEMRRQMADAAHAALEAYVAEADTLPQLSEKEADDFRVSVSFLIGDLADMAADASRPLIQAAFDADLNDPMIVDEEVFSDEYWGSEPRVHRPNDWMAWYREEYAHRNDPKPTLRRPVASDLFKRAGLVEDREEYLPPQPYIAPPKPGRNDPCWCGSGKKYKKCHLGQPDDRFAGV